MALKLKFPVLLLVCLLASASVSAQAALTTNVPAEGSIAVGEAQAWTFTAQSGAVVSLTAQALSGDLDPVLTLRDQAGRTTFTSDDEDYPDSLDARLEAVTLPVTGTYTVTVAGFGETSGDYRLTLLPGFSDLATSADFAAGGWNALNNASAALLNDTLRLQISGSRAVGAAFHASIDAPADFYAQVEIITVSNSSGWTAGLAGRRQGDDYYLLEVNNQGLWRFSLSQGGSIDVLRDWTPHPSIRPGDTEFALGMMANGIGFDFFYDTAYMGSVNDSALAGGGGIGVVVGITSSLPSDTEARFDNLIVSAPHEIDGERITPSQIPSGEGAASVLALKRQSLVAPDGVMALTLPESSVQYARSGINRVMLGRGTTYTNFAMGGTVELQANMPTGTAGCGIVLRYADETNYTLAYLDQTGGYGISQRQGNTFAPGLFGQDNRFAEGRHHLLIIANANILRYYIDRQYVGSTENPAQDGEIGIAVVNFETLTTNCIYTNFWLWEWE